MIPISHSPEVNKEITLMVRKYWNPVCQWATIELVERITDTNRSIPEFNLMSAIDCLKTRCYESLSIH